MSCDGWVLGKWLGVGKNGWFWRVWGWCFHLLYILIIIFFCDLFWERLAQLTNIFGKALDHQLESCLCCLDFCGLVLYFRHPTSSARTDPGRTADSLWFASRPVRWPFLGRCGTWSHGGPRMTDQRDKEPPALSLCCGGSEPLQNPSKHPP